MSGKFGGGGVKCFKCGKTAYTAEQISYEKQIYHIECFRCTTCNKKTEAGKMELWDGKLYDRRCFTKNGFAHKSTKKVVWVSKTTSGSGTGSGKYGGGGAPCTVCKKTVYGGEQVTYDKMIYHAKCMKCTTCSKKIAAANASKFADNIYCNLCFKRGGFSQKQTKSTWVKGASTGTTTSSGKWGGGGAKCIVCSLTVYGGESVSYEKHIYHPKCMRCTSVKVDGNVCNVLLGKIKHCNIYENNLYCGQCWKRGGYAGKQGQVAWTPKTGGSTTGSSKFGGGGQKCATCAKTAYSAEAVPFEGNVYHPKCLICSDCNVKTTVSHLNMFEKNLICGKCWTTGGYKQKQMKTEKKETGTTSTATDSRFNKFGGGGEKCDVCKKTVYPAEKLSYEKHTYHGKCFTCQNDGCGVKMKTSNANYRKSGDLLQIYCEKCYRDLGLNRAQLNDTTAGQEPVDAPEATEEAPEATEEAPEATEEAPETPDTGDTGDRPELD